jgi:hypothetical protein
MKRAALLVVLASLVLFAPSLNHFFVSDDFLNFERNGFQTLADALGFFSTKDIDFYRPVARLHFGILRGFAGDRVLVWNLVGVLLHAVASCLAVVLATSLLGAKHARAARWAGLFFALHFIHVEPVVWASGVTSVWVTIFVFFALIRIRQARRTRSTLNRVLAVLAFAAALGSKETAIAFVPLWLLTTWWWPVEGAATPRRPTTREALPFVILLAAYFTVTTGIERGGDASPYQFAVGPNIVKNVAFFALGGFVPLRYWEVQNVWEGARGIGPFLGALTQRPGLAAPIALGVAALIGLWCRGDRHVRGSLLWILLAATPFLALPGSGERFLYLPSFGACLAWGLAAKAVLRWGERSRRRWIARAGVLAALGLHVGGSLDRQADWITAASWTREITGRWPALESRDARTPIEFVGVPDDHRSAWVFRNGFDSMVRLYWRGRPYAKEGELPEGLPEPDRLAVLVHPNGTVGMLPARLLPEP